MLKLVKVRPVSDTVKTSHTMRTRICFLYAVGTSNIGPWPGTMWSAIRSTFIRLCSWTSGSLLEFCHKRGSSKSPAHSNRFPENKLQNKCALLFDSVPGPLARCWSSATREDPPNHQHTQTDFLKTKHIINVHFYSTLFLDLRLVAGVLPHERVLQITSTFKQIS